MAAEPTLPIGEGPLVPEINTPGNTVVTPPDPPPGETLDDEAEIDSQPAAQPWGYVAFHPSGSDPNALNTQPVTVQSIYVRYLDISQ